MGGVGGGGLAASNLNLRAYRPECIIIVNCGIGGKISQ